MLYTSFWGLSFPPFSNDSRPETFVPAHSASLCLGRLRYALGTGMGASALFGGAGVGKSRVARMLLQEFAAARWLCAYLPAPAGTPRDILSALAPAQAAAVPPGADGMTELRLFLVDRAAHRQPVLLVVDDVQAARGTDFLETLRALLNIEHDGMKALSILLVGQSGASTDRKLALASGFDGQLLVRAVLGPMTEEETRLYILARLKVAGSRQGIFTKHAADRVVEYSRGVPRQVNRLCELSLVIAYGLEEKKVTPEIVGMAAADLDLLPPDDAAFFAWPQPAPAAPPEPPPEPEGEDILAQLSAS